MCSAFRQHFARLISISVACSRSARILWLAIICALPLTGCISGSDLASNPGLNAALSAAIGTPLELTIYSEMYFHQNNRWPTNYKELVSFLHQSPYIRQTNGEPPLAYCRGADFTVLTNGDLRICYISAAQTNFLSTNQIVLSPVETNTANKLEIREIKIEGAEIKFKETNSDKVEN